MTHTADRPLPSPLGVLLAVLRADGETLYLSPELRDLLGPDALLKPLFWRVVGTHPGVLPAPGRAAQPPTLVELRTADGQQKSARMYTARLPDAGIDLHSFLLETGQAPLDALGAEQVRQMLYQLPVAAVGVSLSGALLYANAQAIRNAQMVEGGYKHYLGLNDRQFRLLKLRESALGRPAGDPETDRPEAGEPDARDLDFSDPDFSDLDFGNPGFSDVDFSNRGFGTLDTHALGDHDRLQTRQRTENLQRAIRERRKISWVDQVQLPGLPPEYWKRSYSPVYDERGELSMIAGLGTAVTDELHRNAELELLGLVMQNSGDAVLVADVAENIEDSRITFANRGASRLLVRHGLRPLVGRSLAEISGLLISDEQREQLQQLLRAGRGTSDPVYYARGTPSERCLELSVVPGGVVTSRGNHSHLCITIRDITESHRARMLEQGRARALQLALGGAPLRDVLTALVHTTETQLPGLIASVMLVRGDQLFYEIAPGLPAEFKAQADGRRIGPGQGPCALAAHTGQSVVAADFQHDARFPGDWQLAAQYGIRSLWSLPFRGKRGQVLGTFAVYGQVSRVPRPGQLETLRQLADLTALIIESRQASELLEQVSYHDALTGLPNRPAFMQRLEERLGDPGGGKAAVALIDLTGFRTINEAYGQAAGNRLLQQVAGRLHDALMQLDLGVSLKSPPMLARLGGDEFVLLLPDINHPDELLPLGARLRQAIAAPFQVGEQQVTLRVSIGWSLYPELATDAVTLISQADTAMYTARQEGLFERLYSHHGAQWTLSPTTIRAALEVALDQGQMHLAYQPLIGPGGRVRSFEALLRWTHPEYGNIGPDQFIPVAEMSGMIRHIGLWVLGQAARTALHWPGRALVSVNISGRQFEHPGFAAEVAGILAQTGLPADRLELELTESALMTGDGQATVTLKELDELGVRVALDDYGVGYSNLMRLHTLPISTVKLDRSFTRDLMNHTGADVNPSAAIIRSVVGLAHDLGLEVVAEGIETPEQLAAVLALGCDAVQGYFYSRPVPAPEALRWLLAREQD
ncbi:EAL domain-containing protein [Deinococcus radiomollis]|uniref:sensor domain-containing protein n=1 Tax=Deinococcus radiomollis TaxID=468916 RepID=UPI0038912346